MNPANAAAELEPQLTPAQQRKKERQEVYDDELYAALRTQRERQRAIIANSPLEKVRAHQAWKGTEKMRRDLPVSRLRYASEALSQPSDYLKLERDSLETIGEYYRVLRELRSSQSQELKDEVARLRSEIGPIFDEINFDIGDKLVIHPEEVPEFLVEAIDREPLPKRDKIEKLRRVVAAIPKIKQLIDSAGRFEHNKKPIHRVLIMQEPTHLNGQFLVTSQSPGKDKGVDLSIQEDMDALIRHYHHMQSGYRNNPFNGEEVDIKKMSEGDVLSHIEGKIDEFIRFIDVYGCVMRDDEERQEQLKTEILAFTGQFDQFIDEDKKKAMIMLAESGVLYDKRGHWNPSAKKVKVVGSRSRIRSRRARVERLEGTTFHQMRFFERHFQDSKVSFESVNELFKKNKVFHKAAPDRGHLRGFKNLFETKVAKLEDLEGEAYDFEPLKTYRDLYVHYLKNVDRIAETSPKSKLTPMELREGNRQIFQIYLISRVWEYERRLKEMLFELRFSDHFDPEKWNRKLEALLDKFDPKNYHVQTEERIPEFIPVMRAIQAKICQLVSRLYGVKETNSKFRDELAKSIKELSFRGLLREHLASHFSEELS